MDCVGTNYELRMMAEPSSSTRYLAYPPDTELRLEAEPLALTSTGLLAQCEFRIV